MDKQRIEEQLQQSTRPQQTLTSLEKDVLFSRVMANAEIQKPWWERFALPIVALSAAGAAVAIFFVLSAGESTPDAQTIVRRSVHDTPTTNTNDAPQTPDETIATLEPLQHYDTTIFSYIFGMGGGGGAMHDWSVVDATVDKPNTAPSVVEQFIYRMNEQQMRTFAGVFGELDGLRTFTRDDDTTGLTTLPTTSQNQLCLEAYAFEVPTERCVYVNNRGIINMEQPLDAAQADGTAEALQYITQLTGLSADQWVVTALDTQHVDASLERAKTWKEFEISPKTSPTEELPYITLGWHIALDQGKLVSFTGAVLSIQHDAAAETFALVNASTAIERMRDDFSADTSEELQSVVGFYGDPFGDSLFSTKENVTLNVEHTQLEYQLFLSSKESPKKHILRLLPVYRMTGREAGTDNTFEVFIDATADHVIHKNYTLIYHPGELF
jgi:hypothetical protein